MDVNQQFSIEQLKDYQVIAPALNNYPNLLIENLTQIDDEQIALYIKQAENEHKILVFNNISFASINYSNKEINIPIIFSNCEFTQLCKLTSNSFFYPIYFINVKFKQQAKFKLSFFFNNIAFVNCQFKDEVSFERVKFLATNIKYRKKNFKKSELLFPSLLQGRNKIDFLGVTFNKKVTFMNSNFGCSIVFSYYLNCNTIFYDEVDFSCNIDEVENLVLSEQNHLNSQQELDLDKFHRVAFLGVRFYDEITFENRIFQKKTIFKETIFYQAPKFHNCDLHEDTNFYGVEFRDTISEGAAAAYRSLKSMMDKKRARREENMFFALEQRSLLNTPLEKNKNFLIDTLRQAINSFIIKCIRFNYRDCKPSRKKLLKIELNERHAGFYISLTEKIISFLYLIVSNYGQSITRPFLICCVNLMMIFPPLYMIFYGNSNLINNKWYMTYKLSFQQLFRPFEVFSTRNFSLYADISNSFYYLATFQSLLNVGLITLIILAIRGKFRMY